MGYVDLDVIRICDGNNRAVANRFAFGQLIFY